jgi:hypothetical protein
LFLQKTLPTVWGTYMKLVTKYQISAINSCRGKCNEKCAYMFNVHSRQTGSRNLWVAFLDPSDSYFLFADLVGLYTHWTYMHIFRHIFLSNYWWQRSDFEQTSIFSSNKMNCELMFTYDTPALWQTGSRNLTGHKTLPTIWGTYMKLVTKYQISANVW